MPALPDQILNTCPECNGVIDVSDLRPYDKTICPLCQSAIRVRTRFNHFTIQTEIGEGGMSRVFLAFDNHLGRDVALKILHSHFGNHPELTAQFEREAKITASINHPHVVQVYSVGWDQAYFYIAMELLESESLERQIIENGRIPEAAALRIVYEVTQGLAAAQTHGLIHRDIKPGNILMDRDGTSKLVDFGLALVMGADSDGLADMWATPYYVPPEKLKRQPEDFRSDIYSLGATLFHMMAGKPPFDSQTNSVEELIAIKAQAVDLKAAAPFLSEKSVALVHHMMSRRPEQRPASYQDLLNEIAAAREAVDPEFTRGLPAANRGVPVWVKLGGVAAALAAIAGVAYFLMETNKQEKLDLGKETPFAGTGGGEVVVSATDMTLVRQLDEARADLARGDRAKAAATFQQIVQAEGARADLVAWSYFHLGLLQLLDADLQAAKGYFEKVTPLADKLAPKDKTFFNVSVPELTGDAVMNLERKADAGPLFPLMQLAGGLKNWALGDYRASETFLDEYLAATATKEDEWILRYREYATPFAQQAQLINQAPVPQADATMEQAQATLATLDEIIRQLRYQAGINFLTQRKAQVEARVQKLKDTAMAEAMGRDQTQLQQIYDQTRQLGRERKFTEGLSAWKAAAPESEKGKQLATSCAEAWERAGQFSQYFATQVGRYNYNGEVLRIDKPPFNAKVLGINGGDLLVDLGFGASKVPVSSISAEGLMKIAKASVLADCPVEQKEGAAYFAWLMEDSDSATELSEELAKVPEFARRWEALTTTPQLQ